MEHHFSWIAHYGASTFPLLGDHHYGPFFQYLTILVLLMLSGVFVRWKLARMSAEEKLLPAGKASFFGLIQYGVEWVAKLVEETMGHHYKHFTPLIAAIFFIVFTGNVLGMFPGFPAATADLNVTVALGLFVFVVYNVMGLKESGTDYLKHFFGPLWMLAPLILVIELISHAVRPISMGLRLRGNVSADHMVFAIFNDQIPSLVNIPWIKFTMGMLLPLPFLALGLLVCFIQAFVFTMLSMVYLSLATAHDH